MQIRTARMLDKAYDDAQCTSSHYFNTGTIFGI